MGKVEKELIGSFAVPCFEQLVAYLQPCDTRASANHYSLGYPKKWNMHGSDNLAASRIQSQYLAYAFCAGTFSGAQIAA